MLEINRRRIYDVLHVLSTLGVITRISNKQYIFVGFEQFGITLSHRYWNVYTYKQTLYE